MVAKSLLVCSVLAFVALGDDGRAFAFGGSATATSASRTATSNTRRLPAAASVLPTRGGALNVASLTPDEEVPSKRLPKKRLTAAAVVVSALLLNKIRPSLLRPISNVLSLALRSYENSLVTNPLPTKVMTGASLAVIGDYLAQVKDGNDGYDVPRAASFAAFDSCYRMFQHVAIPQIVKYGQGHVFLSLLSALPLLNPTLAFTAAMERTFLYQFVLIPFFYYPIFFAFTGFMQGLSPKQALDRARTSFLPCWKRNLLFWIPTQMVMFGLVAERWQIPFVCVMGILWSLILSVTAGKAKSE